MSLIKLNNRAVKDVTEFGSISSLGSLTHISTATASSSASIEFTSGIDSTYKEYVFYFHSIHPQNDNVPFTFNGSIDGGSTYAVTKTTTLFRVYHYENDSGAGLGYRPTQDLAQSTGFQDLVDNVGNDADTSCSGCLRIFNPSSTTFVKHFLSETIVPYQDELAWHGFVGGYFNDGANDINAIKFQFTSGNIDSGEILLFGVN